MLVLVGAIGGAVYATIVRPMNHIDDWRKYDSYFIANCEWEERDDHIEHVNLEKADAIHEQGNGEYAAVIESECLYPKQP